MAKQQFEKISGYRKLCQQEIDAMNRIKDLEQQLMKELVDIQYLQREEAIDPVESGRCLIISKQKVQEASMWGCRAVALPQ